jgi:hypothetical protein
VPTKVNRSKWDRIIEYAILLFLILVVAAILFPAFVGGNVPSPRRACLSRVKQLTMATIVYSTDDNDSFPPFYTFDGARATQKFIDVTMDYTKFKDYYLCPKDDEPSRPNQEGIPRKMSYVHCLSLRGVIPEFSTGKRILNPNTVPNPAETTYLRDPIRGFGKSSSTNDHSLHFWSPHEATFVIGYVDGHAKFRTPIGEFKEL